MASLLRWSSKWTLSSLTLRGVARWRPLSADTTSSVVNTNTNQEMVEQVSPDELVSYLSIVHVHGDTVHTVGVCE